MLFTLRREPLHLIGLVAVAGAVLLAGLSCASRERARSNMLRDAGSGLRPSVGEVKVEIHDDPPEDPSLADVQAVNVTVLRVDLHRKGWERLSRRPTTFNLLELAGDLTAVLANAELSPGVYNQIRLVIAADATLLMRDGHEEPLKCPSCTESGIKITERFPIEPGRRTRIVLDFDPDESIHYTRGQGWIMDPVIKVDQVVVSPDCSALNEDAACTMGRYDWTEERCLAVARPEDYVCADDKTCKAGVCVPLGTSPTTEQAYVADQRRRLMTTPDSETTFQLSFVDWLSPTQLNTLLVGTDLRIIRAKLLLPDVMNGLRLAVLLPGEPVVLPALDQPIEDAAAQLESLNPELATHLRAPGVAASARIGSLVGRGMATKVLRLWTLHPEAVRLVQVIESEVDKGQKPWEPGEDF